MGKHATWCTDGAVKETQHRAQDALDDFVITTHDDRMRHHIHGRWPAFLFSSGLRGTTGRSLRSVRQNRFAVGGGEVNVVLPAVVSGG